MSVRGLSDLEEGQHQHTEVIKRQIGNWLVYLDNHSVIRAMTRNIGPRMMTDLLSQLNAIPNLETQVPIGGTFWIQDNKTKSSFFFKRLDIPSEPLAVRCETGVKDDPRAGRNTPVFRVNAYTGPETPKDIQGMKQAKLISRFVGPNVMATNLAANIQKGHLNSGDAIRNPATQDSKRYDTAFKQAQQMDKEVDESLPAKNLNQLYKIKQQLAHPALGTAPPEPAPRAEPVRPTQPRVSAALADLERRRAKLNKIMDLKQELETLTARAGRTRYGITPGLAADIEDIYPEPKSEADMDAMLQGYEIQKKKLTDYIARQRKVFPKESVEEGEVVPFRRPQAQPLLPQDVLHLANEWFWANDDTNTLQAVTDQGYGQGAENLVKYIQAQLQSKGWTIDFDDEIDNIVLTNRSGQTVALPVSDAYDGTGWATGTLSENFEDGRGPGRPGDSQRHGIPKGATMAELEKASHAKGRKGQLARWQLNMRRGKAKAK
jgi:hypothetical protein